MAFLKDKLWHILRSWYIGGGPEQGVQFRIQSTLALWTPYHNGHSDFKYGQQLNLKQK